MGNVLCKTETEFNRGFDVPLFGVTYSKHMVQVNDQFLFSMIRNGKIIAWLYVSFGSRVDYGAVNRLYLGYLKRSLNVGGVDVMSRPFEGLKEEIKFYYMRTEVISFGAPFVSVRNGISSSSGVRVLGEEHEDVNGSGMGTTGYVFLRIISSRLVLYVVANHRGTTRIQVGVMIATRYCGVGNCSLTATQWHTGAAQWRPDKGEITSGVLHSYTGGFFDIGTDIRVIPGLVDFSAFLKHMFVSMSMIIIDAGCWWLFPILGRTSLTISKYLSVGTIFSSTGTMYLLHALHHDETPLLYNLVFGGGVVHNAISVVLFTTVRLNNANTLVGKAALHIFLDFLCLYSTSTIRGATIGLLITTNIAGLGNVITRWVVPNVFKFGVVDPIVGMIIDTKRHILYARAEEMQFQVGAELMKDTRNDLCKMIPKTLKHDVMGVLAAVILFPLVNSEYFGMEYLGGIMLLYFHTWQNWLLEWLLGPSLVTYILYVTVSYMFWTFGRAYTQTDIRSLSDQLALRMLIACHARKVTCQSTMAAVVKEHGCGIDGTSELRSIPFKGGGDDTDMDHDAMLIRVLCGLQGSWSLFANNGGRLRPDCVATQHNIILRRNDSCTSNGERPEVGLRRSGLVRCDAVPGFAG